MIKRTISGAVYLVILTAFFILRQCVFTEAYLKTLFFTLLITFFNVMATFEVARAVRKFTFKSAFVLQIVCGALVCPVFYLGNLFFNNADGYTVGIFFDLALVIIFMLIYSTINSRIKDDDELNGVKNYLVGFVPFAYPSLLTIFLLLANALPFTIDDKLDVGFVALLLIFTISSTSDVFAYLVGSLFSKLTNGNAKKLCPKLSPKKTVAGAIGGIVGGTVGSLIIYFIFKPTPFELSDFFSPVLLFVLIGIFGSIFNEAGDLLESLIKRKTGIKDMGNVMPGHGGVADRIDGTLACAIVVSLTLVFFCKI